MQWSNDCVVVWIWRNISFDKISIWRLVLIYGRDWVKQGHCEASLFGWFGQYFFKYDPSSWGAHNGASLAPIYITKKGGGDINLDTEPSKTWINFTCIMRSSAHASKNFTHVCMWFESSYPCWDILFFFFWTLIFFKLINKKITRSKIIVIMFGYIVYGTTHF